ncbi:MAG TPA: formylmethanofuran dehydrogenase [Burkholderiales bacterium]
MSEARPSQRHVNVVCPFCGLGCDDLEIASDARGVRVEANGCPISVSAFARAAAETAAPTIGGAPAAFADAVARAADILDRARAPLLAGLGTDVAGMRAALALAERLGAALDHMNGAALQRNAKVLRETGWVTTTLSEVRNRADVVVLLGGDVAARFPRFYERLIERRDPLFPDTPATPELVFLGGAAPRDLPASPSAAHVLPCATDALGEVLNALRALVGNRALQASAVAGIEREALRALAERLTGARYAVFVWAAGLLDAHGDLAIDAAAQLVKELNRTTRAAGLPLAGRNGDLTANQVALWQTGYPLPLRFARGFPEHDPYRDSAERLLARGAADALVWISAFEPLPPPAADIPTVALVRPGTQFAAPPAVGFPVATPGVDHAGHVFRCDNVVALPLRRLRAAELPSVAEVLDAIAARLGAGSC